MAIGKGLIKKAGPLTGKEFRFLRLELDLSQKALGQLLDKTDQTIAGWEKSDEDVHILPDSAIRSYYSEKAAGTPIAGLLDELAALDRKHCELVIELEETENGWVCSEATECA